MGPVWHYPCSLGVVQGNRSDHINTEVHEPGVPGQEERVTLLAAPITLASVGAG